MTTTIKVGIFLVSLSVVGIGAYFLFPSRWRRSEPLKLPVGLELGVQTEEPQPTEIAEPTPTLKVKTHSNPLPTPTPTPTPTIFPWPTPMPTATPQPNPTPMPTPTPQPTTTPIPTNVPTPTPTIFIAGSGSGCTLEGLRRNCRESCGFQDGRRGYWDIDVDQIANGKIVYIECVIVE